MTTNNEEQEGSEVAKYEPAESRISFIRKNDLIKTLKRVDKSVDKAITYLEQVMADETADTKVRVQAAQYIVDKKIQISDNISKDNLSRCIAESRMVLAREATQQRIPKFAGSGSADEDDDQDAMPKYMPNVLLDHSNLSTM